MGEVLVAIETTACCPSSLLFPLISLSLLSTFHHELSTYCTSHHSSCIQCMCAATESIFFRVSGTYPPLTTTRSAADAKPITWHVVYRHSAESPIQKMCKKFVTHQVALFPPLLNFSASLTLVMYITLYLNVLHSGSWWLTRTTFTRLWSRKLQLGGQLLLPLSGLFPLVPPLLHLLPVLFPIFILPQHPLPYNNNPLLS